MSTFEKKIIVHSAICPQDTGLPGEDMIQDFLCHPFICTFCQLLRQHKSNKQHRNCSGAIIIFISQWTRLHMSPTVQLSLYRHLVLALGTTK